MKLLALVALVLALGVGVFFLVARDTGRGSGRGRAATPEPAPVAAPTRAEARAAPGPEVAPAPSTRQSAPTTVAEARQRYEGTIIGEGAPLAGAEVELWRLEQRLGDARSDERGRFKLDVPAPGAAVALRVRARGFVALERTLQPRTRGGTEMLGNVRLLRGQRLTGRVVDSRGTPIAGAELRAEPGAAGTDLFFARGTSLADGTFELLDAPPGMVSITARARGYGEARVAHTPGRPLEIRMLPGVDLPLLVVDPAGRGIEGVTVTIQSVGSGEASQRTLETDADGRALFEGLSARLWSLRTVHPDYRPAPGQKVQANGQEERLTLKPWPGIVGRVETPEGTPPPPGTRVHALIALAPGDTLGDLPGGTEVSQDGSFRLRGLRPAEFVVRVDAPGFAPTTSAPVKLLADEDGQAGTIVLRSGGQLLLEITCGASKVHGAEVEVLFAAPTLAQVYALRDARAQGSRRLASDEAGRLKIPNLGPNQVWLAIYAEGYAPELSGPHQGSESSSLPIPIELQRAGRALGVVRTKKGTLEVGAQLRLASAGGALGFPLVLATDEAGRYTSAWLPPGHYTLEAFSAEDPSLRSGPKEFELTPGAQPQIDFSL